jgi:hypothetical protein
LFSLESLKKRWNVFLLFNASLQSFSPDMGLWPAQYSKASPEVFKFSHQGLYINQILSLERIKDRGPVWVLKTHEKKTKRELYHFFGILTATGERLERKEAYRTHQNRVIDAF